MDIRLYYRSAGTGGLPLILLHGNGEDSTYFEHQMGFFSRTRWVLAVDTRGHGQSPRGTAPFTIRQFAEDLHGFMEIQGIGRADILGFSDGGNIALIFAMRYPEQVNRLVVNGANLDPRGVKWWVQAPTELEYPVLRMLGRFSRKAKRRAELLGLMVDDPDIRPEDLGQITARTLVVAGTRDMIKEGHTRLICSKLPDARLVILPGDHFVARKEPGPFNRAVEEFLREAD